jgi:uncharacterized membrane protein HdeD (DUF308 family)
MIFLLKGRAGAAMKILIGIALLLLGLIRHGHTPLPILIGAVLIVWGIASAINAWRTGKTANTQAPDRSGRR